MPACQLGPYHSLPIKRGFSMQTLSIASLSFCSGGTSLSYTPTSFSYSLSSGSVTLAPGVTVTALGHGKFQFHSESDLAPMLISSQVRGNKKPFVIASSNMEIFDTGSGSYTGDKYCVVVSISERHDTLFLTGSVLSFATVG
jgi:hypothetical protein